MNRTVIIEQLKATLETLSKPLALLQSSEADRSLAHLYPARRQYRRVCERPNKGNKAIEREIISSYQAAQSLGFLGDFRAWEHLLRFTSKPAYAAQELRHSAVHRKGSRPAVIR
jgi:hypothetical protein